MNIQSLTLLNVQPSQFYISEEKLKAVEAWFVPDDLSHFEPIPVKMLNGIAVMTDGHTRAAAALRRGVTQVPFIEETEELNWDQYWQCVRACRERGVFTAYDLLTRVVDAEEYHLLWDAWCDHMHEETKKSV